MLASSGQVKIMDFGLAQLTGGTRLTKTDTILGTPAYMSPEQAQRLATDRRTDIWSLGIVLYEMVTGRLPFEGEREQAVVYSIINEPHEPITALRAGVPLELDRIVGKALAKNPAERYQNVEDMLVDLRHIRKQLTPKAKRPVAERPVVLQVRLPSRRKLAAVAAVGAVGLLAVGWFVNRDRELERGHAIRQQQITANPPDDPVLGVALSPDGKYIAYGDLTGVHLRLIATGETRTLPLPPDFCFR
jgi:hypothetical protein